MIRDLMLTVLFIFVAMSTQAQASSNEKVVDTRKHRVIMQVTQGDSLFQLTVIGQLRNIKKALPHAEIEVVVHSQGLPMLIASKSRVAGHVEELSKQDITFVACENTMQRQKLTKEDLLPQATTVPSGMAEIILKQEAGWIYVKGGI